MASLPPVPDEITVTGSRLTGRIMVAYVPQIGEMLQGTTYDMVVSEEITHANDMSEHPIEDPKRSFMFDHNREQPTDMNLSLIVSTDPLVPGVPVERNARARQNAGLDRLLAFQDKLMAMRAAQSTATSAAISVYTGLRVYHNMMIRSLTFRRQPEAPNTLEVDMQLVEFRFAHPPRSEEAAYKMDANDGPRNERNERLVKEPDRSIVEATRERLAPRMVSPTRDQRATIRAALLLTPSSISARLGIDMLVGSVSDDVLQLVLPDGYPSQKFNMRINGVENEFSLMFNQMAGRWSFTGGIAAGDCPSFAGRFVEPGFDLFAGIGASQMLLPLDRPGIATAGIGWYDRLTVPLGDGLPATMLALGSAAAFGTLFRPRTSYAC